MQEQTFSLANTFVRRTVVGYRLSPTQARARRGVGHDDELPHLCEDHHGADARPCGPRCHSSISRVALPRSRDPLLHELRRYPWHAGLDDVADLKAQIHDATGIPSESQRLIIEGRELCSPKARLADCLLCEGAVLQLMLTGDGRARDLRAGASVSVGDKVLVHGLSSARGWVFLMRDYHTLA